MMKFAAIAAMLLILAGCSTATMWLYDDPAFFQMGTASQTASIQLGNGSTLDTIDFPYFNLLGQSFYKSAIQYKLVNDSSTVQMGSNSSKSLAPLSVTFGGYMEGNVKYAEEKSSLRVNQQGSWGTISAPGA